jgi:acyl carrier protein
LSTPQNARLRAIVADLLAERGDSRPFEDTESLFLSGRLDSMAATNLIISIEAEFGVEVGGADFDVSVLDSIEEMRSLVD